MGLRCILGYAGGNMVAAARAYREAGPRYAYLADCAEGDFARALQHTLASNAASELGWWEWLSVYVVARKSDGKADAALEKALLCLTALALRDPAHREAYAGLARKLNFHRRFPYWTIRQIVGSEPARTPAFDFGMR